MFGWLKRMLGVGPPPIPPHVKEAIRTVEEATAAQDDGRSAVSLYWRAATRLTPGRKAQILRELDELDRRKR